MKNALRDYIYTVSDRQIVAPAYRIYDAENGANPPRPPIYSTIYF